MYVFWDSNFLDLQILAREPESYVSFSTDTVTLCLNVS